MVYLTGKSIFTSKFQNIFDFKEDLGNFIIDGTYNPVITKETKVNIVHKIMKHYKNGNSWGTLKFDRLIRDFLKSPDFNTTKKSEDLVKSFVEKSLVPYMITNYGKDLKVEDELLDEEELFLIV